MDRSDIAYLVAKTYERDAYGVRQKSESKRKVFCNVDSVSHSEKTENGLLGLNPVLRFSMFRFDYDREETIEYKGIRYTIYDATEYNDLVRLYAQKEQGA